MERTSEAVELHERALTLRATLDFLGAEAACREAVAHFEALEGPGGPNLAHALIDHAQLLEVLDALPQAARCAERALEICSSWAAHAGSGKPGPELVRLGIRAELTSASVRRNAGDLTAAEQACRRALQGLRTSDLPADDLRVEALNSLGVVYKLQGRLDRAEAVYRRAIALLPAAGDCDGDAEAALLHNLGGLAHARGDFAGGEPWARRSLERREGLLGREHPSSAADRAAWAALLEGLGRLDEAERAYGEALAVFEARLGCSSLEVAATLTSLGGVRQARGALSDAERDYRRALAIRSEKLDPNHPDLALTLNDLALLLVQREPVQALAMARRALGIFEARLGAAHPHTRIAAQNLASLSATIGPGESRGRVSGPEHPP